MKMVLNVDRYVIRIIQYLFALDQYFTDQTRRVHGSLIIKIEILQYHIYVYLNIYELCVQKIVDFHTHINKYHI